MSDFIYKNGKKLRCGYTTGSCAAAAAKCASRILLGLNEDASVCIRTPGGKTLELPVTVLERSDRMVQCGVRKDAGDDADVTDGLMICARVELCSDKILIEGGEGVGRALLDTTVSGIAFDMLKTVDMLSSDVKWTSSGFCGKKQMIPVSMGGPEMRCKIMIGGR